MDPDPAIFVIDLQETNKKLLFLNSLLFFEGTRTSFFKDKKSKTVIKQKESRNQGILTDLTIFG
jgi:hypothetical protein